MGNKNLFNAVGLPISYAYTPHELVASQGKQLNEPDTTNVNITKLYNVTGTPITYGSKVHRVLQKHRSQPNAADQIDNSQPLWTPADPESTPMAKYRHRVNDKFSLNLRDSWDLHQWTVTHPHEFWIDLYDYCAIIPPLPKGTKKAYDDKVKMRDIPPFFPGHKLNYAENVLVPNANASPAGVALIGIREKQLDSPENITWSELCELVRVTRSAMVRFGIRKSDVVAVLMANSIWAIVVFLASASIGAIFTSVSPDMGVGGCISRYKQVSPRLLFVDTDLAVRGTRPSMLGKVRRILDALAKDTKLPEVVFVPTVHAPHLKQNIEYISTLGISLHSFLKLSRSSDKLSFVRVPTEHPLVILYSSGTTGPPKCIVSPHGSILNYKKIAFLHNSLSLASTVFQYSSTSWVVWNVMNGHLSVGARTVCYDGGALYPDPHTLLKICSKFGVTYWGTSPRYLLELEQAAPRVKPQDFDLSRLNMVTTTGATLAGTQMKWFYTAFPKYIHLSSIAGGTEICSSWIASNPCAPVYANEMQMWALGHDCDIVDPDTTTGESIASTGQPGELICRKPFPSMPVMFWGDTEDKKKYHEAYFERFPLPESQRSSGSSLGILKSKEEYLDIWAQHDLTTCNPQTRGLQILGRSDGVLNPSGIRFGSSEVYAILESTPLNSLVSDSLCVGRKRKGDLDETVFLFIIPQKDKIQLSPSSSSTASSSTSPPNNMMSLDDLKAQIRTSISNALSPRHVPKFIEPVTAIPYTVNGKKVEVAVKKIISGISDGKGVSSTITNPECLGEYERFRELERESGLSSGRSKL